MDGAYIGPSSNRRRGLPLLGADFVHEHTRKMLCQTSSSVEQTGDGVDIDRQMWLQLSVLQAEGQKQGKLQNILELGFSHLQRE